MKTRGWHVFTVASLGLAAAAAAQQPAGKAESPTPPDQTDGPIDVVVVGRRLPEGSPTPKVPPRCVRRPGDPADLVPVHRKSTGQRVIAPDKNGSLILQADREPELGPAIWQRAGNGIGQYVFRVPDDGLPMCIGAIGKSPSGWAQLRQIVKVTPEMAGKYMHFSALVAARDAKLVRFWLVAAGYGARVMGGDTHTAPLRGTFGWKIADVIVGPVPRDADHLSYGFLLWGGGDVWVAEPRLEFKTRAEVNKMPSLPTSLYPDP